MSRCLVLTNRISLSLLMKVITDMPIKGRDIKKVLRILILLNAND